MERTTTDVDFYLYTESISTHDSRIFFDLLKSHLPERFEAQLLQGSKFPDDPFKHDLIRLNDLNKIFSGSIFFWPSINGR